MNIAPTRSSVIIPTDGTNLEGDLVVPHDAAGLAIFAHGTRSSRFSPRNRFVADRLNTTGAATLLMDLLTDIEGGMDETTGEFRFNIGLLAQRIDSAASFARSYPETSGLRLGLFGASTGAAAALIAASERPELYSAVVSRGGRPDLAGDALVRVHAPTLLIVGGDDAPEVLRWNRDALARLRGPRKLLVVPGAGHHFEEAGTLEIVADAASRWFADSFR
ncbi:MAG: dienelactone hydrolase family protein [Elusimicrobiota bacterium]